MDSLLRYKQRRPVAGSEGADASADVVYDELDAVADLPEGMDQPLWGRSAIGGTDYRPT